ncbi:MAG: ATPase, T2SS/T4P/T4SS family [Candidatus Aenigmatarchaeota archaeon]
MVCDYAYNEEKNEVRINCLNCIYGSSIEDFEICMSRTIDKLLEIKKPATIVFAKEREYEYGQDDAAMLLEIGNAVERSRNVHRVMSLKNLSTPECDHQVPERMVFIQRILKEIKMDPIVAYRRVLREVRHIRMLVEKMDDVEYKCHDNFVKNSLLPIKTELEATRIIQLAIPTLTQIKGREFYRKLFHPTIRPNFMYTRYMAMPPMGAEPVDSYSLGDTDVEIYSLPGKLRKLYHMIPPEFRLTDEEYIILDKARSYLIEHQPKENELTDPDKIRENIYNIGLDMLRELASERVTEERLRMLADILTRYTAGLGMLELLLKDSKIQDISINSPIGQMPAFIFHSDYMECETNIVPSMEDANSWATKFKLRSGRPLDEANPVLDTEIYVAGGSARVAAITRTLSPEGLGFAFRRHRDKPWTYPLFIQNNMIDAFSAGLMWFLVDGSRTLLIAGTRSSGKTAFLGATMIQIMPKIRMITVEDTLELPVAKMRELGYDIERLKSRSVITRVETEVPADEALRTALRLGDSALIIGEVRSVEAKALYEAMRIGALANVVAGTIHGESAYGVFDRVVNDLGVPPTSFKATDAILICNMLRSSDGLRSFRRCVELTEVRKHWKNDPVDEGGFVNLLQYSSKEDKLKPTETLLVGESTILNSIAERVREWRGQWESVWNNIKLREKILQTIVDVANKTGRQELMEADVIMQSNNQFHLISGKVKDEVGSLDSEMIYDQWLKWLKDYAGGKEDILWEKI